MSASLISADSHVFEPGDLWTTRADAKYRERVPQVVRREGDDAYVMRYEDGSALTFAGFATAGKWQGRTSSNMGLDEVPRGGFDPAARLEDMAVDGVRAEVLYPSFGMRLFAVEDADFQAECMRVYNDWLAEFCAAVPDRLIGHALIPTLDLDEGVREVRRAAALGLKGVLINAHPTPDRNYGSRLYEELWATLEELGLPASLHLYAGNYKQNYGRFLVEYTLDTGMVQRSVAEIVLSGVLERYPGLRLLVVESDIGWVAHFLTRMDHVFQRKGPRFERELTSGLLPSELFRRQFGCVFIEDRPGILAREVTGSDILMWGSDYPHNDSTWPDSRETLDRILAGVPEDERRLITYENAARLYGI
jgi:predicted TIM-barrel fold metal-dependent hydrolase